ncbi:MAG: trimeric intracellular cation channel family protein [Lacibacter sp.]
MSFLSIIDILGTFAFAVSGAFSAMEKKLDPFGVIILSFVTAIGGGTLRDVLIGDTPVGWLRNGTTTLVIIVAAIATMLFDKFLKRFSFSNAKLFKYSRIFLTKRCIDQDHYIIKGKKHAIQTYRNCVPFKYFIVE